MHDYHMHTNFSPDSHATMEEMCRGALASKIFEIGFTEHYDLHPDETIRDHFRPTAWYAELERCRELFKGQLTIRAGIEVGEPHIFWAETQIMLSKLPFDYVLGSLHWVRRHNMFDTRYFEVRMPEEAFTPYFVELERMTQVGGFDILSHFDVPVRTAFGVYGEYDPKRYEAVIRPVLKNCIDKGIALDLNTAALRRRARLLTPGIEILRWYVEMGGERVTLGSDAHRPDHVGAHLDLALEAARMAGLKYLTYFEQRQARLERFWR